MPSGPGEENEEMFALLKTELASAELAHRDGDYQGAFMARRRMAEAFQVCPPAPLISRPEPNRLPASLRISVGETK